MKYITLSADEMVIEAARQRAAAENSTLDDQFRHWLNSYAGPEMLERVQKSWPRSHNFGLYDDPVDYAFLEENLEELDLSPTYWESMEEQYRRQGDEWFRFKEFERGNKKGLEGLSDRERHLLFLKEEGRHDREQRRRYLLFLRYGRQQAEAANWLADAGGTEPQIEDIPRRRSKI